MQLSRSEAAEADLDEIITYSVMQFGEKIGAGYYFSFEEAFDLLIRHPFAGQPAEDIRSGLRRLPHRQHRIFYVVRDDGVHIVRILHHAMDTHERF